MATYVRVAQKSDLESGAGKLVQAGGKSIALIRAGDNFFALDNECSHVGGPLCEGTVSGDEVVCPWHAARFSLATGKAMAGPARSDLHSYTVRVQGNDVEVEV